MSSTFKYNNIIVLICFNIFNISTGNITNQKQRQHRFRFDFPFSMTNRFIIWFCFVLFNYFFLIFIQKKQNHYRLQISSAHHSEIFPSIAFIPFIVIIVCYFKSLITPSDLFINHKILYFISFFPSISDCCVRFYLKVKFPYLNHHRKGRWKVLNIPSICWNSINRDDYDDSSLENLIGATCLRRTTFFLLHLSLELNYKGKFNLTCVAILILCSHSVGCSREGISFPLLSFISRRFLLRTRLMKLKTLILSQL